MGKFVRMGYGRVGEVDREVVDGGRGIEGERGGGDGEGGRGEGLGVEQKGRGVE